jgi:hypothetical protein
MEMNPCIDCDHPLRPSRTLATEHPGTKPHKAHGLCGACYARRQRRAAGSKPINRRPDNCELCGRELYSTSQPKPNADAVSYRGNGKCTTCHRHGAPKQFRTMAPAECIDCGIGLRTYKDPEGKHPGTRKHAAKGRCTVCYGRHIRGTDKPRTVEPVTIDPALEAMMRKRRERLARQQRLAQIRRPAA